MKSIEKCKKCNETGEIRTSIPGNITMFEIHKCSNCGGTGRIFNQTYSFQVPSNINSEILNKYDSKITELIREIEKIK